MIENISWIFDGIGTEIFILVVTAIVGGTAIYRFVKNRRWIQEQKAGNYSNQRQEMESFSEKCKVKNKLIDKHPILCYNIKRKRCDIYGFINPNTIWNDTCNMYNI